MEKTQWRKHIRQVSDNFSTFIENWKVYNKIRDSLEMRSDAVPKELRTPQAYHRPQIPTNTKSQGI